MKRSLPSDNNGNGKPLPDRKYNANNVHSDRGQPQPQKKKRISLSCAQCTKRKQKCNREFPCQHCVARKVPELCVPYDPQTNANNNPGLDSQTQARLDSIESVLSVIVRHTSGITHYEAIRNWITSLPFQKHLQSNPSSPASPHNVIRHGSISFPSKSTQAYQTDLLDVNSLERGASSDDDGLAKVGKTWLGEIDGGLPESMEINEKVKMKLDIHGTPAENLQRLITDCGVSPHKIAELVQELPPKPFADKIIDWFFAKLNFIRYPIDEKLFRISYEDLYDKATALDPSNVRALPLVFIVLALAVRQAPDKWAGDEQTRRLSSLRMYWSSRRSILIATAVQSESLELVVSRLLSAMYLVLIHDRRLTECWSQLGASLRTAQAIGLHRDGSKLGLDPFQTEYRRRLWSYLYHADKHYSLVLGRPPSISDSYTDALSPSNIELSDYNPMYGFPPARPFNEPTSALFLILRKKLSVIIGKIVHHFQKLNEPAQYSDVERLQQELDLFVEQLPPHFRMYGPDKTLDKAHSYLIVHRFMLLTEVLVTTIILHRPWLLRKLSNNRYATSRTACFEAAKLDFQIRQDFHRDVPDFQVFAITNQFRMFNSAMIAGISAIIDPRGPDSDHMRKILTTFLKENPWHEVATKDATTRKEVQIIQTLSRRAAKIFEDSFCPDDVSAHENSAALLLALRQSNDLQTQLNAYPKGHQPEEAPTPGGLILQNKMMLHPRTRIPPSGACTALASIHHGGITQSPASTGSHEDDHSQKLLDHWINANTSLAVGGPFSCVPLSSVGTTGMSYLPLLTMSNPVSPMGISGEPRLTPNPSASGCSSRYMEEGGLNFMGHSAVDYSYPNHFSLPAIEGINPGAGPGRNVELRTDNSDEYWNALIDGILGTTSSLGPKTS
ncbi:uncharacterized protein L203_102426 [Cryptococcus depauperatus CBS 7841]|uniref:Zn(2)-C6 fungal-type domain-containing protein n=1 Tax=Cryptococcus depauperatus CBS 7841 TaxID=1295531 RepID=A0AAJ8JRT2_9TREE